MHIPFERLDLISFIKLYTNITTVRINHNAIPTTPIPNHLSLSQKVYQTRNPPPPLSQKVYHVDR